ncbi:Activator of basal transcription 1 [Cichlidogyrus casuarinus]|uniref:Activator of basal transcription 1 n=1 Tax=Cichlidogyrus casuarinus TaxID=1844966 RepID=A0ABD2QM36_9PLAT
MDEKDQSGICYFSTVPTGMNVTIFSEHMRSFGEVTKIYLAPKDTSKMKKQREYEEGWVQFATDKQALKAAGALNAQPVMGSKKKRWHGELWNVRFLPDTTWTDLFSYEQEKAAIHKSEHDRDIVIAKKRAKEFLDDLKVAKMVNNKIGKAKGRNKRDPSFLKNKQKLTQERLNERFSRSHRTVPTESSEKAAVHNPNFMKNLFAILKVNQVVSEEGCGPYVRLGFHHTHTNEAPCGSHVIVFAISGNRKTPSC